MELLNELLTAQVAISLCILALAAFIQATVGFAAALVGLPLLLWAGNDLLTSQIMIISAMLPQNVLSVWKLRRSIDYSEVVVPAVIRIAALPIGVAGLVVVMTWSKGQINQLVGAIVLLAVAIQALAGVEWKNARWWPWLLLTFGGSGILQGLSGMSGPPMVLWVHGQRYSADRARAFLFAMYISNFLPQLGLVWWRFGSTVPRAALIGLMALPLVLVGAVLGLKLGSRLGDRWLRPLTYGALIAIALNSLLAPVWQ